MEESYVGGDVATSAEAVGYSESVVELLREMLHLAETGKINTIGIVATHGGDETLVRFVASEANMDQVLGLIKGLSTMQLEIFQAMEQTDREAETDFLAPTLGQEPSTEA